jgi:hypothetical protein
MLGFRVVGCPNHINDDQNIVNATFCGEKCSGLVEISDGFRECGRIDFVLSKNQTDATIWVYNHKRTINQRVVCHLRMKVVTSHIHGSARRKMCNLLVFSEPATIVPREYTLR